MISPFPPHLLLFVILLAGCSTFEPDLASDRFILGKPLREQNEYLGQPSDAYTISGQDATTLIQFFKYGEANPRPPDLNRGLWQVPQKNLWVEHVNNALHGFLYNNSFDGSSTNFNRELRNKILIGRANKSAVGALLGEPAGKIILPTSLFGHPLLKHLAHIVPQNASEVWCYYYDYLYYRAGSRRRFEFYKFLAVYFNAEGKVIDKFYTESDKTEPRITRIFTN